MDEILIRGLRISTHIGVPEGERAQAQELLIDVRLVPRTPFGALHDQLADTVDYDAAARQIAALAAARPRQLIETLADEIAHLLVTGFAAAEAEVQVRKFILPQTEYVAVRCTRRAAND